MATADDPSGGSFGELGTRSAVVPPGNPPALAPRRPSLRHNLAARFVSDLYGLATSLLAATITARALGPSGRGYYATLMLLTLLFSQLFNLGLGEAAVVLPPRGRADRRVAISATLAVIVPLGLLGAAGCVLVGVLTLGGREPDDTLALVMAGALVVLNVCSNTLAWLLVSRERLVAVAAITMVSATVMIASLVVLVAVLDLGTWGAVLASLVAIAATLVPLALLLRREGISLRPAWDVSYLRLAVRFGVAVQLSNVLVQMAARLDLLFVYRIAGSADAGMYSIALTVGALVGSAPMAIAYAAFPRLPQLGEDEATALTATLFRTGMATAAASALGLALLAPFAIPLLFGTAYGDAVVPTLLLVPAGILWSGQWILCRAAASREFARPLLVSFLVSFLTMVALDLVLIEAFGTVGAALASLISAAAGFAVAVAYCLRAGWPWRPFVPRRGDLAVMVATARQLITSVRGASADGGSAPLAVERAADDGG